MSNQQSLPPLKVLHGLDSDLQLYKDKIVLRRTNWLSRLIQTDRTIYISELESVTLIGPDHQTRPYVRLIKVDGKPVIFLFRAGEWQAAHELNSRLDYEIRRRDFFPPLRTV